MKTDVLKRGLFAAALVAAATPAFADGELSASIALTSDYRFRGISQNDTDPAPQASINWTGDYGFYVGTWASKVNFNDGPSGFGTATHNSAVEWDIYGGKHFDLGGTDLNVEAYYYAYPDHNRVASYLPLYSYFEAIVGLSHTFDDLTVGASIALSPNYFGDTGGGVWVGGTASYTVNDWISISGNVGHQWVSDLDNTGIGYPYTHWDLGATATWNGISLDVRYIDTSISKAECEGFNGPKNNWCGPTVVGTITYNVTLFGG